MKKTILILSLLLLIILLAACSSEETPTQAPTAVPPTAVLLPSPTPTIVFPEGDPRAILGAPDGIDTFDTVSNWTLYNNQCFQSNVQNGQFVMTAKGMEKVACWTFSWPMVQNFYVETEVVMPDVCQPDDKFGLIFRAPDNHRGYLYGVTCDGKYSLNLYDGTNTTVLIPPAANGVIKTGAGQTNRMGLAVYGNEYALYMNGTLLGTAYDSTYLNPGKIGYFVKASTTEPFVSKYNELSIWLLDDQYIPPNVEQPPATTPVPPPAEGAPYVTSSTYVNVRSGPSTLYPVYFVANPGGVGEVIGMSTDGQWWAVKLPLSITETQQGWVSADYVVFSNPNNVSIPIHPTPPLPPTVPLPPTDPNTPTATATDTINVRKGPGTQYESYGVATIGQSAPAIGQNQDGSWIAVAISTDIAPDGIGWVVAYAVTISPADAQLPVISSP